MQDEHRAAIQKCFTSLVEQTDLETMVSALYEKGVFSEAMIEPYKDTSREPRLRKRQLYMDVMRRGPHAFRHLVDALMETGAWIVARELDPESLPMRRPERLAPNPRPKSNDSEYVSLSKAKKMGSGGTNTNTETKPPTQPPPALPTPPYETPVIPKINVIKSTKFMEDNGKDIKLYPTRGRRRGVLVVFSYIEFRAQLETYRRGVDVDCQMLKNLFSEIGLEVISFQNLTKDETLTHMKNLPLKGAECVFIVISSHGYGRDGSWDTDIRCSDGGLISAHAVVDHFNNQNCPALIGIPKVFIFQMCRGENRYLEPPPAAATASTPTYSSHTPRCRVSCPTATWTRVHGSFKLYARCSQRTLTSATWSHCSRSWTRHYRSASMFKLRSSRIGGSTASCTYIRDFLRTNIICDGDCVQSCG